MTTTNSLGILPLNHQIPVGTGTGFSTINPTSFISGNPLVCKGVGNDPAFSNTASVNQITIVNSPVNPSDGVNKNYADLIAAGFTIKASTQAATTANLTATYANGAAGVGATLTNSGAQAAFAVDGYTASVNDRILIKNQTTSANNGVYSVTTLGSGATNWVLTRTTDYDTVAEIIPGSMVPVINGTVNAGTFWTETNTVTTIGTDPIAFNSFGINASQFLQKANNLSDVASVATSRSNLGLTNVATQSVTQYGVLVGGAADAISSIGAAASTGQVLQANTGANPSYSTATYPSTTTVSQLLYSSASNTVAGLATANNGVLVTSNAGVPSWLANSGTAGFTLTANAGAPPSWQATVIKITGDLGGALISSGFTFTGGTTGLTFSGVGSTETLSGTLALANGGTNASLTANNGGIFYSTASAGAILSGTATARQMLQSGATAAPAWSTTTWPATTTANQLLYSSAANTVSEVTTANNGVLVTSNAGVPSLLANSGTAGYVLTANTGAPPSWQVAPGAGGAVGFSKSTSTSRTSTTLYIPGTGTTPTTANTAFLISNTYTPKSAANTLVFNFSSFATGTGSIRFYLFQGTTFLTAATDGELNLFYATTAGTTSSTTYNIYFSCSSNFGTTYINSVSGSNYLNSATSTQTSFTITEYP